MRCFILLSNCYSLQVESPTKKIKWIVVQEKSLQMVTRLLPKAKNRPSIYICQFVTLRGIQSLLCSGLKEKKWRKFEQNCTENHRKIAKLIEYVDRKCKIVGLDTGSETLFWELILFVCMVLRLLFASLLVVFQACLVMWLESKIKCTSSSHHLGTWLHWLTLIFAFVYLLQCVEDTDIEKRQKIAVVATFVSKPHRQTLVNQLSCRLNSYSVLKPKKFSVTVPF